MPAVEALEARHEGRLAKASGPENRSACRELGVLGLPTSMLFTDGREVERLTRDPRREEIEAAVSRLLAKGGRE